MKKIDVSVIIPIYNSEKYLRESLDSVISQSFQNIEIICVDDGSTDTSVKIVQEYMARDPRINLLFQKEESDNAARARNLGLEYAQGTYVLFLDSDDFFDKDMVKEVFDKAIETDADMVMFDGYIYDSERDECLFTEVLLSNKRKFRGVITPQSIRRELFQTIGEAVWNKLFRRGYLIDNNVKFHSIRQCDDFAFVAIATMYAKKIAMLDKRLIYYRKDSVISQTSEYAVNYKAAFTPSELLYRELLSRKLYEEYKISFLDKCVDKMRFYLKKMKTYEEYKKVFSYIKDNIESLPFYSDLSKEKLVDNNRSFLEKLYVSKSPEELLFQLTREGDLYHSGAFKLPKAGIEGKKHIVLYGAGTIGNYIYSKIKEEKEVALVAWVDKKYLQMGEGRIDNPERIREMQYDYIFIAIESKTVQDQVEEYLLTLGVAKAKIVRVLKG